MHSTPRRRRWEVAGRLERCCTTHRGRSNERPGGVPGSGAGPGRHLRRRGSRRARPGGSGTPHGSASVSCCRCATWHRQLSRGTGLEPQERSVRPLSVGRGLQRPFRPPAATVRQVSNYLAASGFRVSSVAQGNRWIDASGTVAQIESTFKTTLRNYSHNGQILREATSALSIPRSIASSISGVIGVSQTPLHVPAFAAPAGRAAATVELLGLLGPARAGRARRRTARPRSRPTTVATRPAQLRTAYGVQSAVSHGNNGHGVTVAIIDAYASPTMLADANAYATLQGEPTFAAGQYTETQSRRSTCRTSAAAAAGTTRSPSTSRPYTAWRPAPTCTTSARRLRHRYRRRDQLRLQNHVANIVSNSYGFLGEDGLGDEVATEHSLFLQAALEGIGFYFSSGDDGDNVIDRRPAPGAGLPGLGHAGHRRRRHVARAQLEATATCSRPRGATTSTR